MDGQTLGAWVLGPLLLLNVGCDWAHRSQFKVTFVNGVSDEQRQEVETILARVAHEFDMIPRQGTAPLDFPAGVYVEREPEAVNRPIGFGLRNMSDMSLVIEMSELNRGSPWKPDEQYLQIEFRLETLLRETYESRIRAWRTHRNPYIRSRPTSETRFVSAVVPVQSNE
jgi:hypothetical protein